MRAREIVDAVRSVIGDRKVRLHEPLIGPLEHRYTADCLDSGQLAYGPYVERFERKLCEITGARFAVALCSGTAALHLAYKSQGGWGDISMPSLTFVATANAAMMADLSIRFTEDEGDVAVHHLGRPERRPVWCIEDAAAALGTYVDHDGKRHAGTLGFAGCFSFNGNKICTAGGGGAVVTDDERIADEIRHLANQAKSSPTEHDRVGFNYRMPNYNAALGLAQLERLPEFLERKALLASRYESAFGELFWKPPEGSNNWLNAILVKDIEERDAIVDALNEAGYESRALHAPLHTLPMYRDCPRGNMDRTMDIWNRCVCLPSGAGLG
jgi:perosamine synthetase